MPPIPFSPQFSHMLIPTPSQLSPRASWMKTKSSSEHTGQHNTLGGKCSLPSSAYLRSQWPAIGHCHCDWQVEKVCPSYPETTSNFVHPFYPFMVTLNILEWNVNMITLPLTATNHWHWRLLPKNTPNKPEFTRRIRHASKWNWSGICFYTNLNIYEWIQRWV